MKYTLTPVEELPAKKRDRTKEWSSLIDEYLASGEKAVKVEVEGLKEQTVVKGLKGAVTRAGLELSVSERDGAVYLSR